MASGDEVPSSVPVLQKNKKKASAPVGYSSPLGGKGKSTSQIIEISKIRTRGKKINLKNKSLEGNRDGRSVDVPEKVETAT